MLLALFCPVLLNGQGIRYKIVAMGTGQWMDPKQEEKVHEAIDRIAEDGYNVISVGSFYFMPQYFVEFENSPYPEAKVYPAEKVRRNTEVFRRNIQYAKSRGIQYVVSRSNSHYVSYPFWMAHQAELNPGGAYTPLLEKAHQNDMFAKAKNGTSPNCVPHQQWTNPCFRNFFLWSTRQVLRNVPELDGFLNAYAEAAWAFDPEAVASWDGKKWKDCIDYDLTDSCFADYLNKMYVMLHQERNRPVFLGIRDWYVKPDVLAALNMPKDGIQISVKYAGFDQPLVNYPPWAMDLHEMGFGVSLDIHVFDAEYPHPVYWYNNRVVNEMCRNIRAAGFEGVTNQDFIIRGDDSPDNPIRRLTQITFASAIDGREFTDEQALDFLKKFYKKGAPHVLASLKNVSDANESLIKLTPAWFWRGDGLSVGGVQPINLWQFFDNPEAPGRMGFVRQNVAGIPEYVQWRLKEKAGDEAAAAFFHAQGRLTPDDVVAIMEEASLKAIEEIEKARALAPSAPLIKDLHASAYINRALTLRNISLIRAAKLYYLSGYIYNGKYENTRDRVTDTGMDYSREVVEQLNEFIRQDMLMRRIMKDYAPRRRSLRHSNTYDNQNKIAATMGLKVDRTDRTEAEFEKIRTILEKK